MGVLKGIAAFKDAMEGTTKEKKNWFNLKTKETANVWLIGDLDEATFVYEHQSPFDFHRKAQCLKEEDGSGKCWACEKAIDNSKKGLEKGWGRRKRIYMNVLVDNGVDEPFVAIWSLPPSSPAWETLLEEYIDNGAAAVGTWRVRASGTGPQKKMFAKLINDEVPDLYEYRDKLYDLEQVVMLVEYDDMEAHFMKTYEAPAETDTTEDETAEW